MKSIGKNYIYNVVYEVLTVITPLITTPYLSRVLGPDCIGTFSYTTSIVSYFELFAIMGVSIYGQREISYHQDDIYERSRAFWNTKLMSILIASASTLVYLVFAWKVNTPLYWIFSMAMLATIVDVTWFFKGMEEFGRIVLRNIILKALTIICIFSFVKSKDDFLLYAFFHVGLAFLSEIFLVPQLRKYLKFIPFKELHPFKRFRHIFILFIPSIAVHVYYMIDRSMIGWITNDAFQNGYYEQALSVVRTILPLVTAMGGVLLPRIGNCFKKNDQEGVREYVYKNFRFLLFLGIPAALGIASISDNFVPWFFGKEYEPVSLLIKVLCWQIILHGATSLFGFQYMIPTQQERSYTVAVFIGAFSNVILNTILIYLYGALGAAIGSISAEAIVLACQLFHVRKQLSLFAMLKSGAKYAIAGATMAFIVRLVDKFVQNSPIATFGLVGIGASVYLIMLIILHDKIIMEAFGVIKKKIEHFLVKKKSI